LSDYIRLLIYLIYLLAMIFGSALFEETLWTHAVLLVDLHLSVVKLSRFGFLVH